MGGVEMNLVLMGKRGLGTILIGTGILVASLISGCAPASTWIRPGASQTRFDDDMAECRRQSTVSTQPVPFGEGDGFERSDQRDRLIRRCMETKGYQLKDR
jgi:hypothetical protein